MMRQLGTIGTQHPKKNKFHKDLSTFLQACKTQKEELLIAGNFNNALGTDLTVMTKLCMDLGRVHILKSHYGTDKTSIYVEGTSKIDSSIPNLWHRPWVWKQPHGLVLHQLHAL